MSPAAIIQRALELKLDVIAVADHNSIENSFYTAEAAKNTPLHVIYGLEAQTAEDVHILCLFDKRNDAETFYTGIYDALPDMPNDPDIFGEQVVVDPHDNVIKFERKLLINGLTLGLTELVETVRSHNGVVIPSHVESERFGLLINMGFMPLELRDTAMEISYNVDPQNVTNQFPELAAFPLITNSDAHYLRDMGRGYTHFHINELKVSQIINAARNGQFQVRSTLK